MMLSHSFPSLLLGIGAVFQGVKLTTKLVLNLEFPEPPKQVRDPMGKPYIQIHAIMISRVLYLRDEVSF